jgi:hypothetical protein
VLLELEILRFAQDDRCGFEAGRQESGIAGTAGPSLAQDDMCFLRRSVRNLALLELQILRFAQDDIFAGANGEWRRLYRQAFPGEAPIE